MAETFEEDDRQMIHTVLDLDDARATDLRDRLAGPQRRVRCARSDAVARSVGAMPHLRLQQRCLSAADPDARIDLLNARAQSLIDVLGESGSFPLLN